MVRRWLVGLETRRNYILAKNSSCIISKDIVRMGRVINVELSFGLWLRSVELEAVFPLWTMIGVSNILFILLFNMSS